MDNGINETYAKDQTSKPQLRFFFLEFVRKFINHSKTLSYETAYICLNQVKILQWFIGVFCMLAMWMPPLNNTLKKLFY